MTNREKYKDEIMEVALCHDKVAFDKEEGIVRRCNGFACGKCLFESKCNENFTNWLEREYEEPLKPCPFCGFKSISCYPNSSPSILYVVSCPNCKASAGLRANKNDAIKAWNTRKGE